VETEREGGEAEIKSSREYESVNEKRNKRNRERERAQERERPHERERAQAREGANKRQSGTGERKEGIVRDYCTNGLFYFFERFCYGLHGANHLQTCHLEDSRWGRASPALKNASRLFLWMLSSRQKMRKIPRCAPLCVDFLL